MLSHNRDCPVQDKILAFISKETEGHCGSLKSDPVYKNVSRETHKGEKLVKLKETVQTWLVGAINDPIAKIIAANSHLSPTQLETLLIDILTSNSSDTTLTYDEKASFRLIKSQISRGSFNRTLMQAKQNVTKSIYTVLLLGYLGVFDTTTLDPYLEIANKLRDYLEAYKGIPDKGTELNQHLKLIETIRGELETSLKQLASPSETQM
jgi:hypothetical protein